MKKFLAASLLALTTFVAPASASFSDVTSSHQYADAIKYVEEEGIVGGYEDGTYKPENKVNRAEFTKILVGTALGYNSQQDPSGYDIYSLSGVPFSDILYKDWYIPYVRKALENGIIGGYPDNTFRGANEINKAEAAKIIVNSLGLEKLPESYNTDWFDAHIFALEELNAVPEELSCSDMPVTRGQLAEMIWRVRNNVTYKSAIHTIVMDESTNKLHFEWTVRAHACDEKGFMTDTLIDKILTGGSGSVESLTAEKTVTLDDSDPNNGSTMYDFDTEQRTNTNVYPDMSLSGMFWEDTWTRGVDWQVVPMEGKYEEITTCPVEGYSSVYDVDPETGFGSPYYAYQGDIYCLKTGDGNHVLLEVLESYNEGDNRFLKFRYVMNKSGGTRVR